MKSENTRQKHNGILREKYHDWRKHWIDRLGGKCRNCGAKENLEFDHINPETKRYSVSQIWSKADLVEKEMKLCQLLCTECHKEKSSKECSLRFRKEAHGTLNEYYRHKCRCQLCRKNYNSWRRQRRLLKGETKGTTKGVYGRESTHGEKLHYVRGCRCELCRKANAESEKQRRQYLKMENKPDRRAGTVC